MIREKLQILGLSKHEAVVYEALALHSPSGAGHIAKLCGLSRSTVYTILNTLTGKGLVGFTHQNEVKQFLTTGTEVLENMLLYEQENLTLKKETLSDISDVLEGISQNNLHIPQISSFEGQEGLKKIYLSMMQNARDGEKLYIIRDEFIWTSQWNFVFEKTWRRTIDRIREEKNIPTKLLLNNSQLERSKIAYYKSIEYVDYAFLPKEHSVNNFAQYILGDTICILSIEEGNLVGTRIVNNSLAQNYIRIHESLQSIST